VSKGDSGTSDRVLGIFLTWMQERKGSVFVVATANNVGSLPPEFLRAGRWDDIFFVNLPNRVEREEILHVMAGRYPKAAPVVADPDRIQELLDTCNEFTGSEIEETFVSSLYTAFADNGRNVSPDDVLCAMEAIVPLNTSMNMEIAALREWGKTRARAASTEHKTERPEVTQIEFK